MSVTAPDGSTYCLIHQGVPDWMRRTWDVYGGPAEDPVCARGPACPLQVPAHLPGCDRRVAHAAPDCPVLAVEHRVHLAGYTPRLSLLCWSDGSMTWEALP